MEPIWGGHPDERIDQPLWIRGQGFDIHLHIKEMICTNKRSLLLKINISSVKSVVIQYIINIYKHIALSLNII